MAENIPSKSGNKWEFTQKQAIIVMIIGGLLLAFAMIFSTETGTTAHTFKVIVGFMGACVLFVGAWRRPMKEEPKK